MSHVTLGKRLTWLIHVMSYVNKSCHILMCHVTCDMSDKILNESCHVNESCQWVMSHINESCHILMSHVTCQWVTNVWYTWIMSHIWISHVTLGTFVTWLCSVCTTSVEYAYNIGSVCFWIRCFDFFFETVSPAPCLRARGRQIVFAHTEAAKCPQVLRDTPTHPPSPPHRKERILRYWNQNSNTLLQNSKIWRQNPNIWCQNSNIWCQNSNT